MTNKQHTDFNTHKKGKVNLTQVRPIRAGQTIRGERKREEVGKIRQTQEKLENKLKPKQHRKKLLYEEVAKTRNSKP